MARFILPTWLEGEYLGAPAVVAVQLNGEEHSRPMARWAGGEADDRRPGARAGRCHRVSCMLMANIFSSLWLFPPLPAARRP